MAAAEHQRARAVEGADWASGWLRSTSQNGSAPIINRNHGASDFALAALAFLLLFMWQVPPWIVVLLSAAAGAALAALPARI